MSAERGYAWADQALDLEVNGVAVLVPGADPWRRSASTDRPTD